jgi:hypothetical protein
MTGSAELKFRSNVSSLLLLMPTFDNNYAFFSKKPNCFIQKRKECKGDIRGSNTSLGLTL